MCMVILLAGAVVGDELPYDEHVIEYDVMIEKGSSGIIRHQHAWNLPTTTLEHAIPVVIGGDVRITDVNGDKIDGTQGVMFHSGLVVNATDSDLDLSQQCSTHVYFAHHPGMKQVRMKAPYGMPVDEEQKFHIMLNFEITETFAQATSLHVKYYLRAASIAAESHEVVRVKPAFLPVGGCGELEWDVRGNADDYVYEFSDAVLPFDGTAVYSLGFLHKGGSNIYLQHRTNGRVLFNGIAEYEGGAINDVSYTRDEVKITPGDSVRVAAVYMSEDVANAYGWVLMYVSGNTFDDEIVVSVRESGWDDMREADAGPSWWSTRGLPIALTVTVMIMLVCIGFGIASAVVRKQKRDLEEDIEEAIEKEKVRESVELSRSPRLGPIEPVGSVTHFTQRETSLDEDIIVQEDDMFDL